MIELLKENIYGHAKRLKWIIDCVVREEIVVEFGCGTGSMISLPLIKMGYSIYGLDTDKNSIAFGHDLFRKEGFDPKNLKLMDLSELDLIPDVIIASEVLEHMRGKDLVKALCIIREKLKADGL